eukprot:Platyproteum_vivax@DN7575_c1_g1_i16.p1
MNVQSGRLEWVWTTPSSHTRYGTSCLESSVAAGLQEVVRNFVAKMFRRVISFSSKGLLFVFSFELLLPSAENVFLEWSSCLIDKGRQTKKQQPRSSLGHYFHLLCRSSSSER